MFEDAVGIVSIFSFYGRIGRVRYLAYTSASLLIGVLIYSLIVGLLYFFVPHQIGIVISGIAFLLVMLGWLFFALMFSSQRCHDCNYPGWLSVIILLPFGQLLLFLMPGSAGDNHYGSQPEVNSRGVWLSLITLPVVIVLIIIMSVIAIPAYLTFKQQASSIEPIQADLIPTPVIPAPSETPLIISSEAARQNTQSAPARQSAPQVLTPSAQKELQTDATTTTFDNDVNAPKVPHTKLGGILLGRAFVPDKASINDGILEIRQGGEFFADLKIVIFTNLKPPYSGRTLKVTTATGAATPQIHLGIRRDKSKSVPDTEIVMKDYYMYLAFGQEKDYKLPVKLILKTTANEKINISGRLTIATSGLQANEGVVNTQHDSLDTISFVGQAYLKQRNVDRKITFNKHQRLMMQNALPVKSQPANSGSDGAVSTKRAQQQKAEYAVIYSIDGAAEQIAKLQLLKTQYGWQVVHELKSDEIFSAHPQQNKDWLKEPGLTGPKVLAARHFELNKYKKYNWQDISEPFVRCGSINGQVASYCEVSYKLKSADQACQIDTYIFDQKYEQWRIKQILATEKMFSVREGRIVARTQTNMLCF